MNVQKVVATVLVFLSVASALAATSASASYSLGSGAIALEGPWDRYAGWLPPGDIAAASTTAVRPALRPETPDAESFSASQARTYALKLRVAHGSTSRFAIFVPAAAGLQAAYVDGQRIFDASRDSAIAGPIAFDAPADEFTLLLQTRAGARGLDARSAFPGFVLFGDVRSISASLLIIEAGSTLATAFLLVAAFFMLTLFAFQRGGRNILAIAILMLMAGLGAALASGALIYRAGPFLDLATLEAARLALLDLGCVALALLVATMHRGKLRPLAALPFYVAPALLAAAEIAMPFAYPDAMAIVAIATEAYGAAFAAAVLVFAIVHAAKGNRADAWLAAAIMTGMAAIAFGRFGPESYWSLCFSGQAGALLLGTILCLLVIKQISDNRESAQALTDYVATYSRTVKRFIPEEFLDNLHKSDLTDLKLGDHTRKEMTIFFSDIRAFTELSESLTVEENFAFINSYLSRVVPIIQEKGGFVDKYVGDGIMALFGSEHGPDDAIRAAIAMQEKMVEYNGHRAKCGYRPISMGVGVHTGDLMLGVVGVDERMENTVISDAVNLSSRLQSITKAFNISLAISEQSFKELQDPGSYKYRFIGKVKVKGKAEPVSVFEIFDGIEPELFERKMRANMFFEQGMLSYYQKDYAAAKDYFKQVLEMIPEDGASSFYLENCAGKLIGK